MRPLPDENEIARVLCRLAAEQVAADPAGVTLDTHLQQDLGFDSLDAVEYVMQIEDHFEVALRDEEVEHVRTPRDLLAVLQRALQCAPR